MIRKAIYLLVVAAVSLTATEYYARRRFPDYLDRERYLETAFTRLLNSGVVYDPRIPNFSEKLGFVLSPGSRETVRTGEYRYTIRTNSAGFRTRETQPRKEGEYRVLLLGDSMFFGVGAEAEQTIPARLEDLAAQRSFPRHLTAYSYSMLGYNTVQNLIAAQLFAPAVDPDHIIVGIFVGNDLITNAINFIDGQGNLAADPDRLGKVRNDFEQSLSFFVRSIALRAFALNVYVPRLRYQTAADPGIIRASYRLLADFEQFARTLGVRFSVVVFYPKDAVQGGGVQLWSGSRRPGRLIARYCAEHDIPVLDLLDFMDGVEDRDRYYFENDGHLNPAGNALVAELIFDRLITAHLATHDL